MRSIVCVLCFFTACSGTKDTAEPSDTDEPTGGELPRGQVAVCSDLLDAEASDHLDVVGTIDAVGAAGDAGAPAELCSSATRFVTFTDGAGVSRFLGWRVLDASGVDVSPALAAAPGDPIDVRYAQQASGYSYYKGFALFDGAGALQVAISLGEPLDPAQTAPLTVAWEGAPYTSGAALCGPADAYRLVFTSDADEVAVEMGASAPITVGGATLTATNLEATRVTDLECTDVSERATQWMVGPGAA